eukprot:9422268-Lingulodinium_polyedra.AAC.1
MVQQFALFVVPLRRSQCNRPFALRAWVLECAVFASRRLTYLFPTYCFPGAREPYIGRKSSV